MAEPAVNRHMDPRQTAIALNTKTLPQTEQVFNTFTAAQVGFVKVAAPTWTPDWQPADCRCGPNSETRKHTPDGRCASPGKHPMGPGWQDHPTTEWRHVETWLTNEGYSAGLFPLPGSRIVGLDEDVPGTMDQVPGWDRTMGDITTAGKRHAFFRLPDDVEPDALESRWVGGDLLHDGTVRQFVAPGMLHPSGRRLWNGVTDILPITRETLAELGAIKTGRNGSAGGQAGGPLIVVADDPQGYTLPERVETGGRHDEIARMVASLWNRKLSLQQIAVLVRSDLVPRFAEIMDDHRLTAEIEHAYETLERKGWEPNVGAPPLIVVPSSEPEQDDVVIDPLVVEQRIERPEPMVLEGPDAPTIPVGLAMLLDHYKPLCDASYSSLALTTLATMSALFGPVPSLRWRGRHRASLFGALVGHSGYGRKGTAMRVVETALRQVDPILDEITASGMASGEVLVDILNESKKNALGSVLIAEHELARVLLIAGREGSTLSANLRMAWDGDRVETRSRAKGPSVAVGYSASMIGGTTPAELEKRLSSDDLANGWAGRFLWFWSERDERPVSNSVSDDVSASVAGYLRDCIEHARHLGGSMLVRPTYTMRLDPEAEARLDDLARRLDKPPVGTLGAVQQRMLPNVVRVAINAALLDQTAEIGVEHVLFGEACAAYAMRSLRAVFGVRVDDPVSMSILDVLGQAPGGWLNTTDLRKATGGKDYARIKTALRVLLSSGLVVAEQRATGGRPAAGYRLASRGL